MMMSNFLWNPGLFVGLLSGLILGLASYGVLELIIRITERMGDSGKDGAKNRLSQRKDAEEKSSKKAPEP